MCLSSRVSLARASCLTGRWLRALRVSRRPSIPSTMRKFLVSLLLGSDRYLHAPSPPPPHSTPAGNRISKTSVFLLSSSMPTPQRAKHTCHNPLPPANPWTQAGPHQPTASPPLSKKPSLTAPRLPRPSIPPPPPRPARSRPRLRRARLGLHIRSGGDTAGRRVWGRQ